MHIVSQTHFPIFLSEGTAAAVKGKTLITDGKTIWYKGTIDSYVKIGWRDGYDIFMYNFSGKKQLSKDVKWIRGYYLNFYLGHVLKEFERYFFSIDAKPWSMWYVPVPHQPEEIPTNKLLVRMYDFENETDY